MCWNTYGTKQIQTLGVFRLQPVCLFPSWVEWKSNLQRVQDYCRHARESQLHSKLFNLGKPAHLQVKVPGVYKAVRRHSLNSAVARSWLTMVSPCPCFPPISCADAQASWQMGPTAFSAFIWDSFIPEDVVGKGMASRRHPRFSLALFLCQGVA